MATELGKSLISRTASPAPALAVSLGPSLRRPHAPPTPTAAGLLSHAHTGHRGSERWGLRPKVVGWSVGSHPKALPSHRLPRFQSVQHQSHRCPWWGGSSYGGPGSAGARGPGSSSVTGGGGSGGRGRLPSSRRPFHVLLHQPCPRVQVGCGHVCVFTHISLCSCVCACTHVCEHLGAPRRCGALSPDHCDEASDADFWFPHAGKLRSP